MNDTQTGATKAPTAETEERETAAEAAANAIDPGSLTNKEEIANANPELGQTQEIANATIAKKPTPAEAAAAATHKQELEDPTIHTTGFSPLRAWCNKRLRQTQKRVAINYGNLSQAVTEITADGHIRLEHNGAFRLIPLDERFIPALFEQLL